MTCRMHYIHEACPKSPGIEWEMEWDCACNDRCPACDMEIEPIEYDDISNSEEE